MILEIADFRIGPGQQTAFEAAMQQAMATAISQAKGFHGYTLNRCIETPERFVLMIHWETLEDHTVGFRESPAFQAWCAIVAPFFAAPPVVEHFELALKS